MIIEYPKKVNIKGSIDSEKLKIEKDDSFPSAYVFELPLDSTPDRVWESLFENQWKRTFDMLKRKVTVEGDKLKVVTTPDEIKDKIKWVMRLVDSTNSEVERYNEQMKRKEEAKEREKKSVEETIKDVRERL